MTAKSVIDVILGEAKAGSYEDMVAIASVIENRARQLGVTPEQVVQVQSEFNAYGKSIPKGNDAHRALAEKALEQVRTEGPVHDATFYATPAASRNLPSGLNSVSSTDGHNFYSDPLSRSIRTSAGFRAPQTSALSFAPIGPEPPAAAPRTGQEAISAAIAPGNPLRSRAAGVAERNSQELALLPSLDQSFNYPLQDKPQRVARGFAYGRENYDINNMNPEAAYSARRAFDNLGINPRLTSTFRSGVVPKGADRSYNSAVDGASASQHRLGNALDISTRGMSNAQKAQMVDALMAEGFGGIGVGSTIVHADTGQPRTWTYGNSVPDVVQDVISARMDGGRLNRYPSDYGTIGAPTPKPVNRSDVMVASSAPATQVLPQSPSSLPQVSSAGAVDYVAPTGANVVAPTRVSPVSVASLPRVSGSSLPTISSFSAVQPTSSAGLSLGTPIGPQASSLAPAGPPQRLGPRRDTNLPSLPAVPTATYVSPESLPQLDPAQEIAGIPPVGIPMPKSPSSLPQISALPDIDSPVVGGVGVPAPKPSALPRKRNGLGMHAGQLAGGVLGGFLGGPIGAVGGAVVGRQLGKGGLPQMGPLSIGPIVSREGFSRTPTGQALNAATRNGGFDNYQYTKSYAAAGGADDGRSYGRALANEQRARAAAGQKTLGDLFR